jgi:hypothetical protein
MSIVDTHATSQFHARTTEPLTKSDSARLVMTSVRLDRGLHQALRQIAFDRRKSLHSLLIEGARAVCQRYQTDTHRAAE